MNKTIQKIMLLSNQLKLKVSKEKKLTTQELQLISKDIQKTVLKAVAEYPNLSIDELSLNLKNTGSKITTDEVLQVIQSISPNKNWHRATEEELQKEILDYLWTLESQILFLLPSKQKDTTTAEFNQIRLQNKQVKVPKDLIRHIQSLLYVESKNLPKFRKFEKDLTILNDIEPNIQAAWAVRIVLAGLSTDSITSYEGFSSLLMNQFKEKFPVLSEKVGKTLQRICDRFVEKYFPKNSPSTKLAELILLNQTIYHNYKKALDINFNQQVDIQDQNKLLQNIVDKLKKAQEIVAESHEGGFLGKLFSGKVKNKDGVISIINEVIESLNEVNETNNKSNRTVSEKVLLMQKLQSDYDNITFVKSQLEKDLHALNDKLTISEDKNSNIEKELQDKTESLERAYEKIAVLQQKTDSIPNLESKANLLREELNTAKDLALRLYLRITKIKADLLRQNNDKSKNPKNGTEQKNNNGNHHTVHKVQQDPATGQTTVTTEST